MENSIIPVGLNLELDNFINWNKSDIQRAARLCAASVQDEECDAIDALIFTKKLSELSKEMDSQIRPIAEGKSAPESKFGVQIKEQMTGVSYNYEYCRDPEWIKLSFEFDVAKKALSERETFLKAITKDIEVVDTETGETTTIHPPVKSGKLGYALKIV